MGKVTVVVGLGKVPWLLKMKEETLLTKEPSFFGRYFPFHGGREVKVVDDRVGG